jgi:hypothetical protein
MKLELGTSSAEIVVERVEVFAPSLEVVDESVVMLEGRGLELEVTEVVDMPVAVLGCRGLELGVTGGRIGSVVFRAEHPEDPASRRTGQ